MAWKYPPHDIRDGYVVDIDPINDNFLAIVNETSGSLNEHNFGADRTALSRAQLAEDAAMHVHSIRKDVSHNPEGKRVGWVDVAENDSWQTFPTFTATKMEFQCAGGMTYMCASFQILNGGAADGYQGYTNRQKGFGLLVALRLDGAIVHDSLLGSGDFATDFFNGYKNRGGKREYTASTVAKTKDQQSSAQGGGGLALNRMPVSIDAVLDLTPGPHVLEIAVRNILGHTEQAVIGSREIFAVELTR